MEVKKMEQAQYLKIEAEIAQLMADTRKIHAETTKIQSEIRWYPWVVGSGGAVAVLGLLLNFWK